MLIIAANAPSKLIPLRLLSRALALCFAVSMCASAQLTTAEEKGLPANSTFSGGDADVINVQNGNLHITVPIYTSTQRGGVKLTWSLMYDTQTWLKEWVPNNCGGTRCNPTGYYVVVPHPSVVSGWRMTDPTDWEFTNQSPGGSTLCPGTGQPYGPVTNWTVVEPDGTQHPLPLRQETSGSCNGQMLKGPTLDGSGIVYDSQANVFFLRNGTQVGNGEIRDSNGNLFTFSNGKDANGRTAVTVANGPTVTYTTSAGNKIQGLQYTTYTVLDANGNQQVYRVDYQGVDMTSNSCGWSLNPGHPSGFSCNESYQPSVLPLKITLPDQRTYVFTFNNNSPGELASLDLPTGAHIAYTYTDYYQATYVKGTQSNYAGARAIASRAVTSDGTTQSWTYTYGSGGVQTAVTDPIGNTTTHIFSTVSAGTGGGQRYSPNRFETSTTYADASGNVLRTVATDYTADLDPVNNTTANVRPIRKTTTLENGVVSKKETDYETFSYNSANGTGLASRMNPTEEREYDFGSGSPGSLIRKTDFTYLHNTNSAYVALNIVDKPATVVISDGSGNTVAQTSHEYDNYSHANQPLAASNAIQHDSGYGTNYTTRGNETGNSKWRSTDGAYLTTTSQYDDAGNVLSTIDPMGYQTSFSYIDAWGSSACVPSGQTAAFMTAATNVKGQVARSTYNACTGTVASTTDANARTTSYSYDLMGRPKQAIFPDSGSKTYCYSDDPNGSCYSTSSLFSKEADAISSSTNSLVTVLYDSLGRLKETQLNSDPEGTVYVDTQYDLDGRAYKTSNPYRSSDSVYWTMNGYDGLGRVTSVVKADGSNSKTLTTYLGNTTTLTDETGKQRKSQTNVLGQMTTVWEDPATLNYETDYQYDGLGNVQKVIQKGGDANSADWRVRTFTYNSLNQLLCSANPEISLPGSAVANCPVTDSGSYITGTVRYQYDNDGAVVSKTSPKANQAGSATVTTTYQYDSLHRLTNTSYTDGTHSVIYGYDGVAASGCTAPGLSASNLVGRMSVMCDGSGATSWSYDALGRTLAKARRIGGVTDQIGYTYSWNGAVSSVTYPASGGGGPFVATYHENGAGRLDRVTGSDQVVYAAVGSTWASGAMRSWSLGPGVQMQATLNARLQPSSLVATQVSSNNTLLSRTYDFHAGSGDNGNLYGVQDGLDGLSLNRPNGSVQYGYDKLNRLVSAATSGTDCTAKAGGTLNWGSTYTIDAWGNLTGKTSTVCSGESMGATSANNRNQLGMASYDAAGNLVQETGVGYSYDAEGRLVNGSGATFTYDGLGERVAKPGKLYWKGVGGVALAETDGNDANPVKHIFLNGMRVARIDPNGTAKFYVADTLGTTALVTDSAGNVLNDSLFFPYGVERVITQNDAGNNYKFTGKERDTETGLDDFGARYYQSSLGRFMTPDWDTKPTAVPYASYGDPQTLNLYSYVENAPLNRVDADGHAPTRYLSTDTTDSESGPYGCDAASPVTGGCSTWQVEVDAAIENAKIEALGGQANKGKPNVEMAQQTYGRQPDGSYKADPADVQAAIKAGKPILEPGNPDHKSECVFACKALSQMKNIGTSQWRKGKAAVGLNDTTDIGLAIATLGSGTYPSQHGNSGIYMGHDANGGIKIVDQWPNNGPEYNHPFEHTLTRHDQGPAMDPSAYFVIRVPNP